MDLGAHNLMCSMFTSSIFSLPAIKFLEETASLGSLDSVHPDLSQTSLPMGSGAAPTLVTIVYHATHKYIDLKLKLLNVDVLLRDEVIKLQESNIQEPG